MAGWAALAALAMIGCGCARNTADAAEAAPELQALGRMAAVRAYLAPENPR